jgi:hypothetical protein
MGSLVHPQSQDRRTEDGGAAALNRPVGTGLIGEEHLSDRCVTTQSGDFEAEDTRRDRKACVEAKEVCEDGSHLLETLFICFVNSLPIFLGFPYD